MYAVVTKNLPKVTADGESGSPDNMEDYNLWNQHQGYHQVKCAENKPYGKSGKKKGWADGPKCSGAMELGKERGVGGRGRTGAVELLCQRTRTTIMMDTLSQAKQGKESRKREVFDEKEMEKTNFQEKAKSQVFFKNQIQSDSSTVRFP